MARRWRYRGDIRCFALPALLVSAAVLASGAWGGARAAAGESATQPSANRLPATSPSNAAIARLSRLIVNLGDESVSRREVARDALMQLRPVDLDDLRAAAVAEEPLGAEQTAALQDVVAQVYLSGLPYPHSPRGFIGVVLAAVPAITENRVVVIEPVRIEGRLPGFGAYGSLLDGDLILALDDPASPLRGKIDFTNRVANVAAGEAIAMRVLRQGRVIDVSVVVNHRPLVADVAGGQMTIADFQRQRQDRADAYWREHFAPIVERRPTTQAVDRGLSGDTIEM